MKKNISAIVFVIVIIIVNLISPIKAYCSSNFEGKRILIIGSYSERNYWEQSIIEGFKDAAGDKHIVKIEFLDSESLESEEYDNSFISLLNLKYKGNIDYIITMDDEAFDLIRKEIFNPELFTYKVPILFVGVNENVELTNDEKIYITGMIERQNNLDIINTMLDCNNELENIYLIQDKSIYSQAVLEDLLNLEHKTNRQFNAHKIEGIYIDEILESIKDINVKDSAIYLCGTFKDRVTNEWIPAEKVIESIKKQSKVPIYSKLLSYIEGGAIGGFVNDGYKVGSFAYTIFYAVLRGYNIYTIKSPHNTFITPIFNYESVKEYNINPLKLPSETVYLNKKPYELLLPRFLVNFIYCSVVVILLVIFGLIYLFLSNRRKARQQRVLLIEAIEREKIRTDFIVTMSHELRTPLNIILNASNIIKIKLDNDEIDKKYFYERLDYIVKNANRLRRYINNLIDVSKIDLGYMNTTFTNENIVSVVEDTTLAVVDLASSHNIEVIFDTEEEEIITAIDTAKIERVILNLLSNSIKFTNDGGKILISMRKEENYVVIEITDNGIGMTEDIKNNLFQKFKRGESSGELRRQYEGSGLGLFIVRELINMHNGDIKVESFINKGTKFIIRIPIAIVDAVEGDGLINESSLNYLFETELSDIDK